METLHLGSKGPMVELLQSTLAKLGFYSGAIDGNFGNSTRLAVLRFQNDFEINTDGIVGNATWNALLPYINGNTNYIIKKGDTLYDIAKKFNTSIYRINFANPNLNSSNLPIGKTIIVPFGKIISTNISYSYNILSLNINALKTVYPFIQTGIIGYTILRKCNSLY